MKVAVAVVTAAPRDRSHSRPETVRPIAMVSYPAAPDPHPPRPHHLTRATMDTASASRHPRASLPAFRRSIHLWPTALALGAIMTLGGQTRAQVNLWSALNDGLQGDRVTLLETLGDPAQAPRTALIVTEEKGLLRSTDGGRSLSLIHISEPTRPY